MPPKQTKTPNESVQEMGKGRIKKKYIKYKWFLLSVLKHIMLFYLWRREQPFKMLLVLVWPHVNALLFQNTVLCIMSYVCFIKWKYIYTSWLITEVTKESIRKSVWNYLEDNDLVQFPRPVHHRIPNFVVRSHSACTHAPVNLLTLKHWQPF